MSKRGKTIALVVAAGSGSRVGSDVPKQYRTIGGKPVLNHALAHLDHPLIDAIRIVIAPGHEGLFEQAVGSGSLPSPIIGGTTRQESVRNGLEQLALEGGVDTVLIHDAARAFLSGGVVDRLLAALDDSDGAVPVLPVVDTLARGGHDLGDTVNRDEIVRVQTPQAFRFGAILDAHRRWAGAEATDDAQVARAAGYRVATVEGDEGLAKLTYASDFAQAEARLSSAMLSRTGLGFDVHAFAENEELWLGGVVIPHSRGLAGHSDADVVLHALTDALLGAAGEGDIGDHFPPSDPQWKGAASSRFVEHARHLIETNGGIIDHADITIICEAPKIGPHRDRIRRVVADLLRLPLQRVSIKATTTERLGFTGRGEGIAAQAVATIRMPKDR
ncbi:bifunctional 2-C-methyl-D-erythritol 4-phosphate cytidylyltransferase/2-C-methyl-D-erythritol 2,4-cyclodiphosphate synthase [Allosphingosinicella flava]|uniref:Bifunctional enzyme IspD/IspF n=1 Tax=Allosphingosinicella flava TaxID=2771430 RepID=A0A7T2GKS6_9SPHN|nr:bifunctional 2-C-methyl-D-erythritol 4-phosphate cytidylyltransferase/2-C-methyl-D-erythritol 2,4-cyclodiphosphate synthase [Sphingosinicella flava]QPQ55693.1 bifunctional 2-C-methyl-D-erythritol 4-phosphate cytidylyltransferase/2-C-methyl-D-erythritol 2,4-cyclodiphosphate synthase [Sphingosinicella flava]